MEPALGRRIGCVPVDGVCGIARMRFVVGVVYVGDAPLIPRRLLTRVRAR